MNKERGKIYSQFHKPNLTRLTETHNNFLFMSELPLLFWKDYDFLIIIFVNKSQQIILTYFRKSELNQNQMEWPQKFCTMRPSNPGVTYSGHPTHPQYSLSNTQAQFFTSRGAQIQKGQNLKYYPSLSGSETDVSTSTENLTQVCLFTWFSLSLGPWSKHKLFPYSEKASIKNKTQWDRDKWWLDSLLYLLS